MLYIDQGRGIRAKIAQMKRSSLEDSVGAVILGILALLLPANAGYIAGPEQWVKLPGKRGRIDMAYNWSPDGVRLINSLCLEYKAPKWAERPASWARAKVQLTDYTTALHAVPQGVGGIYGAVAIGLWIRFYRYDRNTQSLTPLVTGIHAIMWFVNARMWKPAWRISKQTT